MIAKGRSVNVAGERIAAPTVGALVGAAGVSAVTVVPLTVQRVEGNRVGSPLTRV
jgi:hypothetical protein